MAKLRETRMNIIRARTSPSAAKRKRIKAHPARRGIDNCCGCGAPIKDLTVTVGSSDRRVTFCSRQCFISYLNRHRPAIPQDLTALASIYTRARARLEELQTALYFHHPESTTVLVDEELISEISYILEGRTVVLKSIRQKSIDTNAQTTE